MVLPYCTIFVPGGVFFTLFVSWGLQTRVCNEVKLRLIYAYSIIRVSFEIFLVDSKVDFSARLLVLMMKFWSQVSKCFVVDLVKVKCQATTSAFYHVLNLPCSAHSRAAYDCSMAKKRRAEEQALGVPVNKRKSLLMKPRHYSPDMDCKGNPDNKNEEDGLLEMNEHSTAGSKKAWPKLYIFLLPKVILSMWRIASNCGC